MGTGEPEDEVGRTGEILTRLPGGLLRRDLRNEVLLAEDLVHEASNEVDVLVADLDEAAAGFGEEVPRCEQPVAEVAEVGVDAQLPRVAEGLDLLDLAAGVFDLAVLHVALAGGHLPVGAELDAVRGVHVHHLDLAPEALAFGQAGHDVEAVAQDHAVRPAGALAVGVVVEVQVVEAVEPVEGVEERQLRFGLARRCRAAQVLHQHPGVDLFLDVERRGVALQNLGLVVLALPHQLRVQAVVAGPAHRHRLLDLGRDQVLHIRGGDDRALLVVLRGDDRPGTGGGLLAGCHLGAPKR